MDLGLRGRKAIVTGGSKGIGKAITEALVAEGADVAICARGKEAVDETVAEGGDADDDEGAQLDLNLVANG